MLHCSLLLIYAKRLAVVFVEWVTVVKAKLALDGCDERKCDIFSVRGRWHIGILNDPIDTRQFRVRYLFIGPVQAHYFDVFFRQCFVHQTF